MQGLPGLAAGGPANAAAAGGAPGTGLAGLAGAAQAAAPAPEGMAAPPQGTAPGAGLDAAQLMQALAALGAAPGGKGAGQA